MGDVDCDENNVDNDVNAFEPNEEMLNVNHAAKDNQRVVQYSVPDRIELILVQPELLALLLRQADHFVVLVASSRYFISDTHPSTKQIVVTFGVLVVKRDVQLNHPVERHTSLWERKTRSTLSFNEKMI